jgi:multimeric flavodoxin WrbA
VRILVLNGSARKERGVTGKLLKSLVKGFSGEGAEVREFQIQAMTIGPCTACLSCMHRKTGECALRDDMDIIYQELKAADLLVMASPVYLDGMSAQLKAVMDRCMCCMEPFLARDNAGRVRHTFSWRMPEKFVLVSTAGFAETETFGPLIATFRAQVANFGSQVLGEICIPGSIALQVAPQALELHLRLLEEAGRAIAATGKLDPELLKQLNTPPLTVDEYLAMSAKYESWARKQLGGGDK